MQWPVRAARLVGYGLSKFSEGNGNDKQMDFMPHPGLSRLGLAPPHEWVDLTDARYAGALALSDPTKSSSMAKAFENIIQQQMQQR